MTIKLDNLKWQLIAERKLNLTGTSICVVYAGGAEPYHVHRTDACHGSFDKLEDAKTAALLVVQELLEMGLEP